jgi:predicted DNA-binding transcriptional regulator YafY
LSRVLLSAEEACAALLGLAVAERLGFPMFGAEMGRARRKLVDAFPAAERRRLAPLRERILVGAPASEAVRRSYRDPDPKVLGPLQAAIVEERVVAGEYHGATRAPGWRTLEPHAVLINWPAWYLLAWDRDRAGARTFRLDRFRAVQGLESRFRPRPRQLAALALGPGGAPATEGL